MAQPVHLFLKANGIDIEGESTQVSLGRENSIECLYFEFRGSAPSSTSASGRVTGRRRYDPIIFRKIIDKSSPLLMQAFTQNQNIEAEFRFYRPKAATGTTEQFYTIEVSNARIIGVAQYVNETFRPETANDPPLEEIALVFTAITWTYTDGSISHSDSLTAR